MQSNTERNIVRSLCIGILGLCYLLNNHECDAFAINSPTTRSFSGSKSTSASTHLMAAPSNNNDNNDDNISSSRRALFSKIASSTLFALGGSQVLLATNDDNNVAAFAAEDSGATIWKSGKQPIVPGKKPKDKNDTSGTRRDSEFLRSISNCKVCTFWISWCVLVYTYLYSYFLVYCFNVIKCIVILF